MPENVSPHDFSAYVVILGIWWSGKNIMSWWLSSKGKSTKGVHDEVYPKHLDGIQRTVLDNDGSKEDDEHSDDVDSKLELNELSNVVIHGSTELEGNDGGGEVIVKQNNV